MQARTDQDAFAAFYSEYGARVVAFIARRTFDVELAYELHQETFAVAFAKRGQFRGATPEEEQGWLFAIARSLLSDYWRRGEARQRGLARLAIEPESLDDAAIERIDELAGLDRLRGVLADAMTALPAEQREAIQLRVFDERPYAEIAALQSATEQNVRARVSRGLRALGALIDLDDDPMVTEPA